MHHLQNQILEKATFFYIETGQMVLKISADEGFKKQ